MLLAWFRLTFHNRCVGDLVIDATMMFSRIFRAKRILGVDHFLEN